MIAAGNQEREPRPVATKAKPPAAAIRLAIVTSHPIQYNAPAFRSLAAASGLDVRVFYEWEGPRNSIDPEFGRTISWDVPLFDGYDYVFVPNASRDPGSHSFGGIDNPDLVGQLSAWRPDVLLVYGWSFRSHLRVLRTFRGKLPILFRGDSTLVDESGFPRTLARRALLKWIYRHVDIALYTGTRNREYFRAHGLRDDQLTWAPHAVDNDYFSARADERDARAGAWRSELGIPPGDTVFLFAAKLVPRKDPATLLAAFLALRRTAPDRGAHLIFAGEGELLGSLRGAAQGRTDVHFIGFRNQSEMPVVYRLGDVNVLPSRVGETWGLSINEAMACGRAGIVSDRVGCGIDLIRPNQTGFIFRNRDKDDLEKMLERLGSQPEHVVSMGRRAKLLIEDWSIPAYTSVVSAVAKAAGEAHATRARSVTK